MRTNIFRQTMRGISGCTLFLLFAAASPLSHARDTLHEFSIQEALSIPEAEGKVDPSIKLYFQGQKHPGVAKNFGLAKTNKKTNAFNKTDLFACQWTFLSAIIQLQRRARDLGANAVINIKSNYKNREFSSPSKFQCGAGAIIAGVALKGDVVKTN